jgi:hypothetical protein
LLLTAKTFSLDHSFHEKQASMCYALVSRTHRTDRSFLRSDAMMTTQKRKNLSQAVIPVKHTASWIVLILATLVMLATLDGCAGRQAPLSERLLSQPKTARNGLLSGNWTH